MVTLQKTEHGIKTCGLCALAESDENLSKYEIKCMEGYGIKDKSDRACSMFKPIFGGDNE